jgi:hypothetical protein
VISANLHRRHLNLNKQQQADLIVAAIRLSRQLGEVIPDRHVEGKHGSGKDPEKEQAVAIAKKQGISERTIERARAKAEGRVSRRAKSTTPSPGLDAARKQYVAEVVKLKVKERGAEMKRLGVAIKRASGDES